MFKRVTIVALVVAAFVLMLAVPAMAFNGFRADYTVTEACSSCHTAGSFGAPIIAPAFKQSKHWTGTVGAEDNWELPRGSTCMGCHTSNFSPAKVVPMANPAYDPTDPESAPYIAANGDPTGTAQNSGNAASSELSIGCSSCHYGASAGVAPSQGVDANDTAHSAPSAEMANADICGACHSRYSYTKDTIEVQATPDETAPVLLQPQMAIGFPMLGAPAASPATGWVPASPLSDYLIVSQSGVTPTPNPAATKASSLQAYWEYDSNGDATPEPTVWQQKGHDGSASQYPEWKNEGHANALTALKAVMGPNPPASCLECHSADYRIAEEGAKPTGAEAKYGITCVGCHTPHDAGTTKGKWDEAFDAQLIGNPKNSSDLCITCHNGEIPEGQQATPGTEVHHPMKEMMAGYGAIGVDEVPSVHEGKCVQCHMPPTSYGRGNPQLGGNHTFKIIDPEVAAGVTPLATGEVMPYSACSTCHGGQAPNDPLATYLQGTIEQRQSWTKAKIALIWDELDKAAVKLGYADTDAAHTALVAIPESDWTTSQRLFLSSFTNVEFVESEGSFGIHNFAYSVRIVNTAMNQAKAVAQPEARAWVVSLRVSKDSIKKGQKIYFRGAVQTGWGIAASGTITLQRRMAGQSWRNWKTQTLAANGTYSIVQRLNFKKGKWYFRASMPGDGGLNLAAVSPNRVIRIK